MSYPPQYQPQYPPPPRRRSWVVGSLIAALAIASVAVVLITGLAAPGWMRTDAGEPQVDPPVTDTTETTTEPAEADPQAVGVAETFVAAVNAKDQAAAEAQICELNRYLYADEVTRLIEQGQHLSTDTVYRSDDSSGAGADLLITGSEESVGGIGLDGHGTAWCVDVVIAD